MDKKSLFNAKSASVLVHITAWVCFLCIPFLLFNFPIDKKFFILRIGIPALLLAGVFYSNLYVWMPRFLKTKKHWPYIFTIVSGIIFLSFTELVIEHYYFRFNIRGGLPSDPMFASALKQGIPDPELQAEIIRLLESDFHRKDSLNRTLVPMKKPGFIGPHPAFFILLKSIFVSVLALTISSGLKIIHEWRKNEQQKKEMENEKLSSELIFLKSQVNPHFLFNTLNNIYSLANSKSDDAPIAIAKLSQLMRYMLYESNVNLVHLTREIDYLKSYIDLQKLRFREDMRITFSIEGEVEDKMIEPMLLIPFVENAFKHGQGLNNNPCIYIHLRCQQQNLYFTVTNSFEKNVSEHIEKNSGIGLQNIIRRLNLLYPDSHELAIHTLKNIFKAELTLKLN